MADARALLRQQREARRIKHPLAAYTPAGKLACSSCNEIIKAEALWERHIQGEAHRQRLAALESTESGQQPVRAAPERDNEDDILDDAATTTTPATKRKHPDYSGTPGGDDGDYPTTADDGDPESDARRKRSRADMVAESVVDRPSLSRHGRQPSGPVQGVEISMASRPATPRDRTYSSTSVAGPELPPAAMVFGAGSARSADEDTAMAVTSAPAAETAGPARPVADVAGLVWPLADTAGPARPLEDTAGPARPLADTAGPALPQPAVPEAAPVAPQQDQGAVDEDEWAAFEADIAAVTATYDDSAVVASAAAMTAEEAILAAAAKREEEDGDNGEQRVPGHRALQEERDDAARTFEEELDEMQALEARLRRLKERREALRRGEEEVPEVVKHDATPLEGAEGQGVEEMAAAAGGENEDDEDDDDDDDEDLEDDWNGFRIRR